MMNRLKPFPKPIFTKKEKVRTNQQERRSVSPRQRETSHKFGHSPKAFTAWMGYNATPTKFSRPGTIGLLSVPVTPKSFRRNAIRCNSTSVKKMRKTIWAVWGHSCSTNDEPMHWFCTANPNTWCRYKAAINNNFQNYKHKPSVAKAAREVIKPVFADLFHPALLKKCLGESSDETSPNYHTNGRAFELSRDLTCSLKLRVLSGTGLELMTCLPLSDNLNPELPQPYFSGEGE
ncbi:hypothetical protein TNCV_3256751 [Trichonephila clavipes]|nr:hypothetical protein TNCV_3256751 [Trichonephila clavipes]